MSFQEPQAAAPNELLNLYLERRQALVRFVTARTGSSEEGEEVVQEMYFRLESVDPHTVQTGASYLYKMALNLVVDRARSHKRASRRDGAYLDANGRAIGAELIVDEPSPEDALDARRRLELLVEAVAQLPVQCGRVFRLHKLEGKSHAEVAAVLGISRSAVEKHVNAALKHLSARLQ